MSTMSCFSDSTIILTNIGWINIVDLIKKIDNKENIKAIVEDGFAYDIYSPIVREAEPIYEIITESGDIIEVTNDHEFEVKNITTGQIYLKKLKDIDINMEELKIILNNLKTTFSKIKSVTLKKVDLTYDFAVKEKHRIIAKNENSKNAFYTSNCWHPDIEEFITAKQQDGRLTKFNMSVLITDAFMYAVENHLKWDLVFPDIEDNKDLYKKEWDGNITSWIAKGYKVVKYKTFDDANQLWELLMNSTYTRNEPGVLFIDTINKLNNLSYIEYISATNPCGEQILPVGGACLLGSINLTQFIDFENKNWNYKKLKTYIPTIVRFMDNVNDITYVPLETQKQELLNKRRIGLGVLGYGSALMMLKLRYGSEQALKMTDELYTFIANTAYQASSLLAKEKGSFLLYDEVKYLQSEFIQSVLSQETKDMIKKYGIRNSHLLSIQPTGNTSILANNVSGGLEPIFMPMYIRTMICPHTPIGIEIPKIDWSNKKCVDSINIWEWIKEGDTPMLKTILDGVTYKIDKSRGLLKEAIITDYGIKYLTDLNELDITADYYVDVNSLKIDDHISTMKTFAKYVDAAMSKTITLPNEYTFEDFKNVYMDLYKTGVVKGATTYRIGTMASVLSAVDNNDSDEVKINKTDAPKRPKVLKCNIHHTTAKGEKWVVIVGMLGEDPFEVFAFKNNGNVEEMLKEENSNQKAIARLVSEEDKEGQLIRVKRNHYNLKIGELEIDNIGDKFETDEQEAMTRLISLNLRHGAKIDYVFDTLEKSTGSIVAFSKAIARTLKKYTQSKNTEDQCPNCEEGKLVREEGCYKCYTCFYSKC